MEQMTLFFVLGGLLILTLMLASIAQRYHAYLEERRRRIERILHRVGEMEGLLHQMSGLPVPVEVEQILYKDVLARLNVVKSVHSRYEGIDRMIADAGRALSALQPRPLDCNLDEKQLETLIRTLGEVLWMVQERRFLSPVSDEERMQLMQIIALRRAECLSYFHQREANRMRSEGQLHQAAWHCNQIRTFLKENGPDNDRVRSWYRDAEQMYREISQEISGHSDASSSE